MYFKNIMFCSRLHQWALLISGCLDLGGSFQIVEELLDVMDVLWVEWEPFFAGDFFAGLVLVSSLSHLQVGVLDFGHEILVLTCLMYKFDSL